MLFALVAALLAAWVAVYSKTLEYRWFYDDYHLIRVFAPDEIVSALHGNWDPGNLETVGYRPLSLLFNHCRATLFGEVIVLHRLFQVFLMGILLLLVGALCLQLNLSVRHIAVTCVVLVSSRIFTTLLVWLSDGAFILGYALMAAFVLFERENGVISCWQSCSPLALSLRVKKPYYWPCSYRLF